MSNQLVSPVAPATGRGRPEATSHAAIEAAAFALFRADGFEATTLDAIAAELGVGRRTLFRYYRSKNDIPWGRFDDGLADFRALLAASACDAPLWATIAAGIVRFNSYPPSAQRSHRDRMRLILRTPALQAHSTLRYAEWRAVIADFVGERMGCVPSALLPQTAANVSLALALTAYDAWLHDEGAQLTEMLETTLSALESLLGR